MDHLWVPEGCVRKCCITAVTATLGGSCLLTRHGVKMDEPGLAAALGALPGHREQLRLAAALGGQHGEGVQQICHMQKKIIINNNKQRQESLWREQLRQGPAGTAVKLRFMSKDEDLECEACGRGGGGGGATTLSPSGDVPE